MTSRSKGSSKYKKLDATEPPVRRQHWTLALVAGAYIIAVTSLVFTGYAVTSVRYLTSRDGNAQKFPNNSRVDDQNNQRNCALHPNDTEAAKLRQQISSLNNELEALKRHFVEINATMKALNLELSYAHAKEDESVARISDLTEQNGESSANFAKMRASMEAVKLEVFNIRAKGSETESTVSTLMKQIVMLTEKFSKVNDAVNANLQRTSDLEIKMNALAQQASDRESKRSATNSSNSSFGSRKESVVVTLCTLLCLYCLYE